MTRWTYVHEYVKGYAFSNEKLASTFKFDVSDSTLANMHITTIMELVLGDEGYITVTCAHKEHRKPKRLVVVIVVDDDDDEERLIKRDLPKDTPYPSISRIMEVLDGPDVWRKA